tara:strand:+ start:409 stop:531 length:123 start_codon:yes stop_codon:yes gene_type:complete
MIHHPLANFRFMLIDCGTDFRDDTAWFMPSNDRAIDSADA